MVFFLINSRVGGLNGYESRRMVDYELALRVVIQKVRMTTSLQMGLNNGISGGARLTLN